jgi:hypothetical protein
MHSKEKQPFRSIASKTGVERAKGIHIIICPFCENGHPIPTDFDSIHRCTCGACFKVCGTDTLETGVGDIANTLWNEDELSLVRSVPIDFCNVVIEKNFDRLLDLRHTSPDHSGIQRFCKYDVNLALNLVWVKRLF